MTAEAQAPRDAFSSIFDAVREAIPALRFEILEVGALPLGGKVEPFHRLIDEFPGSRVHAFEVDEASFEQLRAAARPGLEIHRAAIGARRERRPLYLANHSMCTSLYRPDEQLLRHFNAMEVNYPRGETEVDTVAIDDLVADGRLGPIDFVKLDIQGAELDAFRGARASLATVVAIVSEVEFVPLYRDQPLFGDVDRELRASGFLFHKFLGVAGRDLRPVVRGGNPAKGSWHLWADAMFVREIARWGSLDAQSLAKLAVVALLYGSPDIALRCLATCDGLLGSDLRSVFMRAVKAVAEGAA